MELEAKFLIDFPQRAEEVLELLNSRGYRVQRAAPQMIDDRYFDTKSWRLATSGWACRVRRVSGKTVLTLKSLGHAEQALHEREEIEQTVAAAPDNLRKIPDGRVREKLSKLSGRKKLIERFRIENVRELHDAFSADSRTKLEIAIDRACVRARAKTLEFGELEIELRDGPREALEELAAAISAGSTLHPARLSKFERGLQLLGARPGKKANAIATNGEQTLVEFAFAVLRERFGDLLFHEPRAWEGLHPEGVHQMRVATRRLRAALRVFDDILPERVAGGMRDEFRWLASVLGEVRDLDVNRANLDGDATALGGKANESLDIYRTELADQWTAARAKLVAALGSSRYRELTARFDQFLERGPPKNLNNPEVELDVVGAARKRIRKRTKIFLKQCRAISDASPDAELHQLRIQGKKLRYLIEIFRHLPGLRLGKSLKALKNLQEVLGEHQDACVAIERLWAFAETLPLEGCNRTTLFVLGRLTERQEGIAERRRVAVGGVLSSFKASARRLR